MIRARSAPSASSGSFWSIRLPPGTAPIGERVRWSAYLAVRAPLESRFPFRSQAAIVRAQRRRLGAVVRHAYEHVPYYRETMRRLGLQPADISTAGDLARLPLIEREDLQRDPEYYVSRHRPLESYARMRTGGSTGEPVVCFQDPGEVFRERAQRERFRAVIMKLAGRRLRYRDALILPSPEAGGGGRSTVFRRWTLLPPSLRVRSLRLSGEKPPETNVERINAFRPDVISGFGSYMEALFVHLHISRQPFRPPRVVSYSSDTMSPAIRRLIEDEFGSEVVSAYQTI